MGDDRSIDSNCQPALVTLPTNASQDLTIDFGYYLVAPAIDIEKYTNGEDADDPSGPIVAVGSPVEWTYVVTNIGNVELINVMVSDDQGVMVTCPETSLMPGESMTCTGQGIAMEGQYANLGTATGEYNGITVEDTDPSHYFGAAAAIDIEKYTNGEDADDPSGPIVAVGSPVEWTYVVTNIGNVELINVMVSDDQGVMVTCPETSLMPGESMTCTGQGIAMEGQYANLGTATGEYNGITVEDTDPSHYFGAAAAIDIEKYTNGEDADDPTGPIVVVGSMVEWTYVVTNTGNVPLSNVMVSDDQGVMVTCPETSLMPGESMTCTGQGIAMEGQYANLGTATGEHNGMIVEDTDPSHYFGVAPSIDLEKYVSKDGMNWFDADEPPGLLVPVCPNGSGYGDKDCSEKDYYWSKYDSSKRDYDYKKSDYEKKRDDRDRSKSDYEKSKKDKDDKKSKYESRKAAYESAKERYERRSSRYNMEEMEKAKQEYEKSKSDYDKSKSDYDKKKSDYDKKKSDTEKSKYDLDKSKSKYDKDKYEWDKYGDKECKDGKIYDKCGDFECESFVYFRFLVTNDGPVPLTEITLEDTVFDVSDCVIPQTLAPGASFECVIGPFPAEAGQHKNTGTATGWYAGIQVMDSDDAHYYGKVGTGTGTPGYWKNHSEAWPVTHISIGGITYSKKDAIDWMNKPVKRDKTLTLFQALVAAKLNVLMGNVSYCIDDIIAAADQWMATYGPVGNGVEASSSAWAMAEPLYMMLDDYNNGLLCAPSRDCLEKDEVKKDKGVKSTSYWKGQDKSWPTRSLKVGDKTYDRKDATKIMKSPSKKDVTYTMFRALVVAKLNVAEGNSKSCVEDTIKDADKWMEKYGPAGKGLSSNTRAWREGEGLFQTLDDYNNGKLCAPFAKDEITSWVRR
ncbi:hypothetical protein L9S41_18450 [Geoalkalibacter halelectricus]|uniref:DUF7507 domain-containing protein n=1 Tax=Geoalkalibacter halelectricus TaxID=2847045 RepID=A0ABY5ZPK9_9BACT|nr:hypothetical protein [Geoalkalibacter halelectricus]UWZ79639.1 hypothetical protein L9S41_18450 [Geoalkalibacter halelectricus]